LQFQSKESLDNFCRDLWHWRNNRRGWLEHGTWLERSKLEHWEVLVSISIFARRTEHA
jgi:hypothetical protein